MLLNGKSEFVVHPHFISETMNIWVNLILVRTGSVQAIEVTEIP